MTEVTDICNFAYEKIFHACDSSMEDSSLKDDSMN